ncbi:FtsH protease activity modulator HflK [Oceanospirillum sediminis]|uniref:Protein HflK n=1 Tax=Oceanospirillum sediminis TaxID=2760088 RepID=A0A839IKD0_9GAMM|nr:FtsH protease activity modulator HflK [Oceanospirillum sediminis]MBB1485002.1 FtsH protease activity modulator HflK [Oceanospirillum sediminis]
MAWNEPGGNKDNNRDPWGSGNNGGRGDQGPPDLDEALKKFNDRLSGILGGKKGGTGGGGGGGGNNGSGAASFGLLGVILVIAASVWAVSGFYRVDQAERAVVLRFGEYYETVGAGLNWNPSMIDTVSTVNVAKVRSMSRRALMLTEDENIVQVNLSVQYRVSNPRDFLLNVRSPEQSLENATESALRHEVGSSEMTDILTEGREALAQRVRARLQQYLDRYGVGLEVRSVNVESTSAPDEVQAAFDDVIKAREDEQRVKNQAEAYSNGVIPEARGKAQRIIEEANGYKEEVVARAEGEADRFLKLLAEYDKAPEVTRERLYLQTMEEVMAKSSKVLVDVDGGNNMMYLPLDRLGQNSARSFSAPANSGSSGNRYGANVTTDTEVDDLADRVLERLRERQQQQQNANTTRREGR